MLVPHTFKIKAQDFRFLGLRHGGLLILDSSGQRWLLCFDFLLNDKLAPSGALFPSLFSLLPSKPGEEDSFILLVTTLPYSEKAGQLLSFLFHVSIPHPVSWLRTETTYEQLWWQRQWQQRHRQLIRSNKPFLLQPHLSASGPPPSKGAVFLLSSPSHSSWGIKESMVAWSWSQYQVMEQA